MNDDPKKKVTPETANDSSDPDALDEDELDNVSGGTAGQVSPKLKQALQRAGQKPMG